MRGIGGTKRYRSITGRVAGIGLLAIAVSAAAAIAAPARAGAGGAASPVSTSAPARAATSIIVVRRAGAHDALWRVSPGDASAVKLVDLPFRPARMVASPSGAKVALLPAAVSARVYVYDVPGDKLKALSFASRGVRLIDGLTWLSATRLLVSGAGGVRPAKYALVDKLYTISTSAGAPASFRGLRGAEPSAAPGAKRLVYVQLRDGGPNAAEPGSRFVVERLMSLKLVPGSRPRVIAHQRYVDWLDIRRYLDPGVSPDGRYVITSTTGSDVSVSYMVRSVATGKAVHTTRTGLYGRDVTAWTHAGDRVAFWSMPQTSSTFSSELRVYDVGAKVLTTDGPVPNVVVGGLTWAPDDSLLAYSLRTPGHAGDRGHLWTIDPGASATPTDLGTGSLPVWVP
jgi:hypothetical protein